MPKNSINRKNFKLCHIISCILSIIVLGESIIFFNHTIDSSSNTKKHIVLLNNIETPMVDFTYNSLAVNSLKAIVSDVAPYKVTILADLGEISDIELLSFYFDEEYGTYLGKITNKQGNIVTISVEKNNFDNLENYSLLDLNRLVQTQENLLDEISSNLPYTKMAESTFNNNDENMYIAIDTAYTQLLYPQKWEKYLETSIYNQDGYVVNFYCNLPGHERVELFSFSFGDASDILIGYFNGLEIGVKINDESVLENLSEEEKEIFYTMKEDMNLIIDQLTKNEKFQLVTGRKIVE